MSKNLLRVALIGLISLLLFWSPFTFKIKELWGIDFGKQGMNVVVQNFDGLNFLVIAKSWYSPRIIDQINAQFLTGNVPIYFAAHFPVFPALITLFGTILTLPNALLAVIVLSNILLATAMYYFFEMVTMDPRLATLLTMIGLFFPARMLSVRSVGSNEPLFIAFILISLAWAIKEKYWASAVAGALAVLTRSPGILLFAGYGLSWLLSSEKWSLKTKKYSPYLIMPLALALLFAFYGFRYLDPLTYFHSGDNLHLFFPPFTIFSNMATWINDMWREDIIYLYIFYGAGLFMIDKKWQVIRNYGFLYGFVLLFVAHRDLARYALPIAPLALLGYAPLIARLPKKTWLAVGILLIPIYLLGWQFVLKNIQPISDWRALL